MNAIRAMSSCWVLIFAISCTSDKTENTVSKNQIIMLNNEQTLKTRALLTNIQAGNHDEALLILETICSWDTDPDSCHILKPVIRAYQPTPELRSVRKKLLSHVIESLSGFRSKLPTWLHGGPDSMRDIVRNLTANYRTQQQKQPVFYP
ncbi:MAG: hypothetical protein JKY15_07500, partial [Deltaproteobacteria bacterium]|nr:hypothetical protein [Deltaproteobacteria bacterium]